MKTEQEFNEKVVQVCTEFRGQIDDLYAVVGMMQTGRLYGWRVMRLAARHGVWTNAIRMFGDPKQWMPERGVLAHKSLGLSISDKIGEYWEIVKGHVPVTKAEMKEIS